MYVCIKHSLIRTNGSTTEPPHHPGMECLSDMSMNGLALSALFGCGWSCHVASFISVAVTEYDYGRMLS